MAALPTTKPDREIDKAWLQFIHSRSLHHVTTKGRKHVPYVTILAALALTLLSTNTLAQEKCTVGTLKGRYVFTGRRSIEALEPGVQRMHYGCFNFDGSGKFTGKQSSSRGGKIGREKSSSGG
ncbi:MAG: hypothetical protein M3Q91_14055 [Acidobacteriota bacterium]|nr:hypothetical protein [Acidobacteriota bacterium]